MEFEDEQKPGAGPLQFDVRPALAEGQYTATITLPSAGIWRWRIDAFGKHDMPPLTVSATGMLAAHGDPMHRVAIGRVLFESKGCATCHSHPAVPGSHSGPGPELPNHRLTAEYLRRC